jgi:hypothetical protein
MPCAFSLNVVEFTLGGIRPCGFSLGILQVSRPIAILASMISYPTKIPVAATALTSNVCIIILSRPVSKLAVGNMADLFRLKLLKILLVAISYASFSFSASVAVTNDGKNLGVVKRRDL